MFKLNNNKKTSYIDNFNDLIIRSANLIGSYTEKPELAWILKSLRLKPYLLLKEKNNDLQIYDWWIDEYGNSFYVSKKKQSIILADLRIDNKNLIKTDLYEFLNFNKIIKITKVIFCFSGIDEDNKNFMIFSLFGIDNYLRTYIYEDEEINILPSLYLGLDVLIQIFKNSNKIGVKKIKCENLFYPCKTQTTMISSWPLSDVFWEKIKSNQEMNCFLKGVLNGK